MNQKMPHWLSKQANISPDKMALETADGTTITFKELKEQSEQFAGKLATLNVTKTNRVAILSNNSVDMVIAIHALSYLGAVAVMLNTKLTGNELSYQIKAANVSLLLTTAELRDTKQLALQKQITFREMEEIKEQNIVLCNEINLEDPFTLMFTSGTTGVPKAVIHTYHHHWWSAIGSALNIGMDKQDKWLLTLPIFHIGGLSILLKSVIYGMEVFLMEKYEARLFYETIRNKQITIISLVTKMLKDLVEHTGDNEFPSHIRCLLLGGGAVPAPMLEQVKEKQMPLFQTYGMTETCSQIVTLSADYAMDKIGSSGKALFPAQIQVIDQNKDGVGEIVVKGPMVISGYDQNPKANEKSFENGWFKTGDMGYIDSDGFLFVVDRRTDLIISGGENIYPQEVENGLLEIKGVVEAAVVGKQDVTWGQVPVAYVVAENDTLTEAGIILHLQKKLASYKIPKKIYFISSLPRNATNKVMRHLLKETANK